MYLLIDEICKITFEKEMVTIFQNIWHQWALDRVPKKSKFSEWPAEFIVYSRDKYKNFLLTKFLKILKNARAHQQLM